MREIKLIFTVPRGQESDYKDVDDEIVVEDFIGIVEGLEIDKSSTVLLAAGDLLSDYSGSCPHDLYGWHHPETCGNHCSDKATPGCWVEYVRFIAANSKKNINEEEGNYYCEMYGE